MNAKYLFGASVAMITACASFSPLPRGPRLCFGPETGAGSGETAEQMAIKVKAQFDESISQAREIAERALHDAKDSRELSTKTKETADEALLKMNGFGQQLATIEQHMAQIAKEGEAGRNTKSLGQRFVEAENVKGLLSSTDQRGRAAVEFKETITTAPASAGVLVETTRLPGIIAPPDRRLTVRDLITPGTMDGNTLEYIRETGFTNAASTVAEEAKKPESSLTFDDVQTSAKVIAHYSKASRQILSDAPQLASYIDGRLRYGLAYKEESQLLNGDGTGQNLLGIMPQATAYVPALTLAAATKIDKLRLAQLQAVLAEYPATGHVLNPIDWADIELTKDGQQRYLIGQPQGTIVRTLWGLPVVETQAMGVGDFLSGAFKLGAQLFDRWLARVEIATENEDDFVKNRVTILAEERIALAVYRPEAFIKGKFA